MPNGGFHGSGVENEHDSGADRFEPSQVVDEPQDRPDKAENQHAVALHLPQGSGVPFPQRPGSVAAAICLSTSLRERAMRKPTPAIATNTGRGAVQMLGSSASSNIDQEVPAIGDARSADETRARLRKRSDREMRVFVDKDHNRQRAERAEPRRGEWSIEAACRSVYAHAVTGSPEHLADAEFARLCSLLERQRLRNGRCGFAEVWSTVREWALTVPAEAVNDEFLLGFECNWNPNTDEDRDYPVPPEGVPTGPLFDVGVFRDFQDGGETGVQLWYQADDDWKPVTDDPDFDIDHPVSYHFWGHAGPRAANFVDAVESTPGVHVAARKSPALVRVFQTRRPDLIVHCDG